MSLHDPLCDRAARRHVRKGTETERKTHLLTLVVYDLRELVFAHLSTARGARPSRRLVGGSRERGDFRPTRRLFWLAG